MRKLKSLEQLMLEIKIEHDKDNRFWRILRGKDEQGHYNSYIISKKHFWMAKIDFKNPLRPIGIGTRVPLPVDNTILKYFNKGENFTLAEYYPLKKNCLLAIGIGKYSTEASFELRDIINGQYELEKKLDIELKKLLKREEMFKEYA